MMDGEEVEEGAQPCWLCKRVLGEQIEWHHPVPKSRGGRIKVAVHPICHRTLHANFGNGDLARVGDNVSLLRENAEIAKFLSWIAGKPPDFHAATAKRRR
jgi:hypothetical protein